MLPEWPPWNFRVLHTRTLVLRCFAADKQCRHFDQGREAHVRAAESFWKLRRENYGRAAPRSDNLRRRENQSMAKGMDRKKETKKPKKDKK
jgi:hypothetical protein